MSQTTTNLALTKSAYVQQKYPTTVYPTNTSTTYSCGQDVYNERKRLYFGFNHLSDSLKNRRLYNVRIRAQAGYGCYAYICKTDFNASTLCWDNVPERVPNNVGMLTTTSSGSFEDRWLDAYSSLASMTASYFLKTYACYLEAYIHYNDTAYAKTILSGGGTPYLEVTYDDSINVKSKIVKRSAPSSGYVNPRNATSFSWGYERDSTETYYCFGDFTQSSAALKWKASGGSWNTVNASGSSLSLTVAANTFPTNTTIEWYLTGTDTAGTTSETDHYTFSTAAGTASAYLISPINSVEDGSKPITVQWNVSTTDGQAPLYYDLWWKLPPTSESNWTSIRSHVAWATNYTVSANVFPAGECQLALRAYNVDDVAGPWYKINGSTWPSFICVAAPAAPSGLQATQVPRTTVTWQATGQEAYEVEIDGVTVEKRYGPSVVSYISTLPLSDGTHTIRVRIQGVYGLWSSWASTTINITNVPPWTLTLTGVFGVDARLTLSASPPLSSMNVQWFRDGKRIGWVTDSLEFTDRFALGQHEYYAELWATTGYYARSNTVIGTMKSCETRIALYEYGSPWITLNLSENSDSVQSFTWSKASSLRHVRGAAYPVVEIGEGEDLTASYDCAFTEVNEAKSFEALKGKRVIIKSRGGEVVVGALTRLSKRMKDFYITYSFSVQQIHLEDFVRYDEGA